MTSPSVDSSASLTRHSGPDQRASRILARLRAGPLPLRPQGGRNEPRFRIWTSWSSACAGSDQMTAPPDQATAGWSRSQRPWIRSVPTQDSDRGCSEWAVQQTGCAGGIAHIQACAAWARHGCFGSRGCSGLAMPLPRPQLSRRGGRTAASARRCTSRAAGGRRRPPRYRFYAASADHFGPERSSHHRRPGDRFARKGDGEEMPPPGRSGTIAS